MAERTLYVLGFEDDSLELPFIRRINANTMHFCQIWQATVLDTDIVEDSAFCALARSRYPQLKVLPVREQ